MDGRRLLRTVSQQKFDADMLRFLIAICHLWVNPTSVVALEHPKHGRAIIELAFFILSTKMNL